tara:strand:- start:65 stop:643 length:579 start_codon:yes stop_codon:yes gene_type:complete
MSIKQLGGVFGRNPTFNDVTIEGTLTFDGDIDINSDLKIDGNLEVTGTSTLTGGAYLGGTGASHLLNDYETGTFTTTVTPQTSGTITFYSSVNLLSYTQIGDVVTMFGSAAVQSVSSPVGAFVVVALPFTAINLAESAGQATAAITLYDHSVGTYTPYGSYVNEGTNDLTIYIDASTLAANDRIIISLSYKV